MHSTTETQMSGRISAGLEIRYALDRMNNLIAWRESIERNGKQLAVTAGKAIRRYRVEILKLSLRATAKKLRISAPYLSDIERGRRNPYPLLNRIVNKGVPR